MPYTIGDMARTLGLATSALRYYDKEGLLPFVERSEGGRRVFKQEDIEWLKVIECLKKTGMQLRDIRSFIEMAMQGDATIKARLELIRTQKEAVEKQMTELRETLETLEFKEWYYETALTAGSTSVPRNMPLEELPERFRPVRRRLKNED